MLQFRKLLGSDIEESGHNLYFEKESERESLPKCARRTMGFEDPWTEPHAVTEHITLVSTSSSFLGFILSAKGEMQTSTSESF